MKSELFLHEFQYFCLFKIHEFQYFFLFKMICDWNQRFDFFIYLGNFALRISFCPYFLHAWPSSIVEETAVHVSEFFLQQKRKSNQSHFHEFQINAQTLKIVFTHERYMYRWITSSCNSPACSSTPCSSHSPPDSPRRHRRTGHNTSAQREPPWRISRSSPPDPQLTPTPDRKRARVAESATGSPDPGHEPAPQPPFSDQWKAFLEEKFPLKFELDQWVCVQVEKRETKRGFFKMGLECEKIRGKVKRKYRENQWKRERKNPPKS